MSGVGPFTELIDQMFYLFGCAGSLLLCGCFSSFRERRLPSSFTAVASLAVERGP